MLSLTSEVYTAAGVLVRHTVCSRSRHGAATERLTSDLPGNIILVPKPFTLLEVGSPSQCDAESQYLLALILM